MRLGIAPSQKLLYYPPYHFHRFIKSILFLIINVGFNFPLNFCSLKIIYNYILGLKFLSF